MALAELVLGPGEAGHGISKASCANTGKAIAANGNRGAQSPCPRGAPGLVNFIGLRKIEVQKVEIKASYVYEIGMERQGAPELFFVPVRAGTCQRRCRGLEDKGMSGKFIVK